jgi:hypothetical protein
MKISLMKEITIVDKTLTDKIIIKEIIKLIIKEEF